MSAACVMLGAASVMLAAPVFTLDWQHSVEHVTWRETWGVEAEGLVLQESAIKGSGAGMEPGETARLVDGWWVSPGGLVVRDLNLAASGATGGGWRFCADGSCREIGATAGAPLRITPCAQALSAGGDEG